MPKKNCKYRVYLTKDATELLSTNQTVKLMLKDKNHFTAIFDQETIHFVDLVLHYESPINHKDLSFDLSLPISFIDCMVVVEDEHKQILGFANSEQ